MRLMNQRCLRGSRSLLAVDPQTQPTQNPQTAQNMTIDRTKPGFVCFMLGLYSPILFPEETSMDGLR
jgi:hypothetical protein